jgi:hypothetical protein
LDLQRSLQVAVAVATLGLAGCTEAELAVTVVNCFVLLLLADAVAVVGLTLSGTRKRAPGWGIVALSLLALGVGTVVGVDAMQDVQKLRPEYDLRKLMSAYALVGQPLALWPLWLVVLRIHRRRRDPKSRVAVIAGMAVSFALLVATAVACWRYF